MKTLLPLAQEPGTYEITNENLYVCGPEQRLPESEVFLIAPGIYQDEDGNLWGSREQKPALEENRDNSIVWNSVVKSYNDFVSFSAFLLLIADSLDWGESGVEVVWNDDAEDGTSRHEFYFNKSKKMVDNGFTMYNSGDREAFFVDMLLAIKQMAEILGFKPATK